MAADNKVQAAMVDPTDQPVEDLTIYNFGEHVRVDFFELFSEPDSYKDNALGRTIGDKVIRIGYYNLYTYVQAGFYYLLSVIIGAVMSLVWAILTGLNTILMVWIVQPGVKFFFTWLKILGTCWKAIIRTFCDPCWQSTGLSLSMIRAKINLGLGGLKGGVADMIEVQQV